MALELLAGPIDVTHKGASAYMLTRRAMWADGVGIVGALQSSGIGLVPCVVIGLDGVARERNGRMGLWGGLTHNLDQRRLAMWDSANQYEVVDSYIFDSVEAGTALTQIGAPWTVLPDRWISAYQGKVRTVPRQSNDVPVDEFALPVNLGGSFAWITPARKAGRVMIGGPAGLAYEYDYLAKQLVGYRRHFGMTCLDGVFYSAALGIWITLSQASGPTRTQMRIWADEVAPASLSAPAAQASVVRGAAIEMRARLLGAHSDPCVGMPINWSVSAGPGSVDPAQSLTDADGYASTALLLPPTASGNTTVEAEAVF